MDFMPSIQDFEDFTIRDKKEMEELESNGYNFGFRSENTKIALDNDAIIFCIFIKKELAHIGRLSLTEKGKRYVDNRPFRVNFEKGEAVTGSTWTNPKFRGKGLMKYGYFKRFEFLRESGIKASRNSVETSNEASNKVHAKFEPKIYAEARYRKLLFFFKFWKETPISAD